ncbi:MAG: hypothetical protein J5545_07035 [Bacteroidaceae bacterium]|nr:hypothetical protein [Bacteroidaceae bacterium]
MKRIFLLFTLLLSGALAWADGWYGTSPQATSETETPVYLQVKVYGVEQAGVEVAAYVNGECRAIETTATDLDGHAFYLLRVKGSKTDVDKMITFKVFHNKLVYSFPTKTQVFDEETVPPSTPIVLNVDAVTDVSLTNPIELSAATVSQESPATRALTAADVIPQYDDANRQNESVLETTFEEFSKNEGPAILTIEGNVLKATAVTPPEGLELSVRVKGQNYGNNAGPKQYSTVAATQVIVTEAVVPVTQITLTPNSITAHIGDNYLTAIANEVVVSVTPNNATNQEVNTAIDNTSTATVEGNVITGPGLLKVIFSSVSNPEVTATLTINVPTPVSFNYPSVQMLSKLAPVQVTFTNFAGDEFDKSKIAINISNATNGQPCATAEMADDTGLKWNFQGLYVGAYNYQVSYDGNLMNADNGGTTGVLQIPAEVPFNNNGWDWISLYAYENGSAPYFLKPDGAANYLGWLTQNADNKVIEVRSQTGLLYNDVTYGFVGEITELSPAGGMYKVKAKYADPNMCIINTGFDCVLVDPSTVNTIQTGYTWISYPLETATTIADTRLAETAQVGDKIIGKASTAEYNGTAWLPADFTFQPGKGYIYYTEGNGGFRPNFYAPAGGGVKRFAPRKASSSSPSPWKYDASPFADNMPVVAALEGVEDGERFSIGAYVGDECRGEGRAVDGNLFMINVAGKAGELVHFRLFDQETGEFTELEQSLIYSAMHGSLRAPVKLSGKSVVDGIGSINNSQFTINNAGDAYNLAGQKVNKNFRGIVVKNGRKMVK